MSTLVTYFSIEKGKTAAAAETLAGAIGADLFEIRPERPYTKADINYLNPLSRCNKEKIGRKDVPLAAKVEDWDKYDTVFIGFPIWYNGAPNVIETFVKSYDFTGKKVALFATSGGSDIARSPAKLQPLMKGEIVSSKLLNNADEASIKAWAESV